MENYIDALVKRIRKIKSRRALRIVTEKTPILVKVSLCVGILSLASFFAVCIISAKELGKAGMLVGVIPVVSVFFNIVAFIISYRNLQMDNIRKKWVVVSSYLNGALVILYLVLYIIGAF